MKITVVFGATALALAAATVTTMPPLQVSAGTAGSSDAGVSSTPLSTWQTNSTVWALAYSGGVVYAGGQFTSVRPPGNPQGTGEVPRTFLAAFSSSNGALITSFNPTITGGSGAEVTALAVSGNTLYVGGNFTHINGVYRDNLAAFNLSTGALTSWAPTAFGTVLSISPSPDGSEIYLGGSFNKLDGVARTFAGAVTASGSGTVEPWDPVLNNSVTSVAVSPDDSHVMVGGYFTQFNGVTQNAIGSTFATTGASDPHFTATIVPDSGGCSSSVKDVIIGSATRQLRPASPTSRPRAPAAAASTVTSPSTSAPARWSGRTTAWARPSRSCSSTTGCSRAHTRTTAHMPAAASRRSTRAVAGSRITCSTSPSPTARSGISPQTPAAPPVASARG